jgi:hypothetical protein
MTNHDDVPGQLPPLVWAVIFHHPAGRGGGSLRACAYSLSAGAGQQGSPASDDRDR